MQSIEQIDSIYKTPISQLPIEEKIIYCENPIDKAQLHLVLNKKHMNTNTEDQLYQVVVSAQAELINY